MNILSITIDRLNLRRFFSGEGPQQQPLQLHHRKVYILPTRHGLTFAILLLFMLVGSINYSNSLGYMLTFLLASLSVITILFTYQNLLNLTVSIGQPDAVYAGNQLLIPFYVANNRQSRFSISITHNRSDRLLIDIPVNHNFQFDYMLPTVTRGRHALPRFTFSTTFPLGLFKAWSYVEVDLSYLVYPKPAGVRILPQQATYLASLSGDQGRGTDDFAGQREYHPGDSLRQVNWKVLARSQALLTKQFGGDRCEELWLEWSQTQGYDTETRLSQLVLWALEAERAGISYGLRMPNGELSPASGEPHKQHCMKLLALYE
ncbi:MAG: DUF58 domain-containing protein [Thioalkalispiraceae bacterium]|jgi:uncharacterized protein (DUF58 family)